MSGAWLTAWRSWVLDDGDYDPVKMIVSTNQCAHHANVIPGYMNHFILGVSSVPCAVGVVGVSDA